MPPDESVVHGSQAPTENAKPSDLPSVDRLLRAVPALLAEHGHTLVADCARELLERLRAQALTGSLSRAQALDAPALAGQLALALQQRLQSGMRRVLNLTGTVIHTNLGRAPLPDAALAQVQALMASPNNLEYELATGGRGDRDSLIEALLCELTGAEAATVVNNNAAAVLLCLAALAARKEVIVSRGELVEIGGSFRIPDIMARSGAVLREVGTTNKTTLDDYRRAINERTRLILRVHPSNFHISGFTAKPTLKELASLGVPVYEDLGSGCLVDLRTAGVKEPLVGESLEAGVALVSFSCDKLLGGPQTGIIAGQADLVARVRRNPMYRAFRPDKLIVQALETTLRHLLLEDYDKVPTLRMIRLSANEIKSRAERLVKQIPGASVRAGKSVVGGGSTPDQELDTWLVALPGAANVLEKQMRANDPPIIARIENDQLVIDLRTVQPDDEASLVRAAQALAK